jgi:hypothetical protein
VIIEEYDGNFYHNLFISLQDKTLPTPSVVYPLALALRIIDISDHSFKVHSNGVVAAIRKLWKTAEEFAALQRE